MRTYLSYILLGVALLLSGCNNDELQGTPSKETLEVVTEQFIEANSETYSISVNANCQWNVEMLSGWERLQLGTRTGSGNESIKLVTPKNDETTSREAFLLVTSQTGVIVRKIHVQQRGIDPYITLSQTLFEPTFRAETYEVTVTSNAKWVITAEQQASAVILRTVRAMPPSISLWRRTWLKHREKPSSPSLPSIPHRHDLPWPP